MDNYKAICEETGKWIYGFAEYNNQLIQHPADKNSNNLIYKRYKEGTLCKLTNYSMFDTSVYLGDIVSNNYGSNDEVLRIVILYKGCLVMELIKGRSKFSKYILLHDFHNNNYRVVNNIHTYQN